MAFCNFCFSNQQVTKSIEIVKPTTSLQMIREPFSPTSTPVFFLIPFIGDDVGLLDDVIKTFNDVFMNDPTVYLQIVIGERYVHEWTTFLRHL